VVFYAGEMLRELLREPPSAADNQNPIRLFAGSGLRRDAWKQVVDRFGPVGILEFYASTEGNAVLANASGEKEGALGRPLPGSAEVTLGRYDFDRGQFERDADGLVLRPEIGESGVLLARLDTNHPVAGFASGDEAGSRLLRGVSDPDDTWFVTWDVLRQDEDGDFWFVDRVSRMLRTPTGRVSTRSVEDALYGWPLLRQAVVIGVPRGSAEAPAAIVATRGDRPMSLAAWNGFAEALSPDHKPTWIQRVDRIPMTQGFRPDKAALEAASASSEAETFVYDEGTDRYVARTGSPSVVAPGS
ncbi:MAG: hypothetical protein WBG86_22990, partial [Polyangiales bacterium]